MQDPKTTDYYLHRDEIRGIVQLKRSKRLQRP